MAGSGLLSPTFCEITIVDMAGPIPNVSIFGGPAVRDAPQFHPALEKLVDHEPHSNLAQATTLWFSRLKIVRIIYLVFF
jgi:hypothetical protein